MRDDGPGSGLGRSESSVVVPHPHPATPASAKAPKLVSRPAARNVSQSGRFGTVCPTWGKLDKALPRRL